MRPKAIRVIDGRVRTFVPAKPLKRASIAFGLLSSSAAPVRFHFVFLARN
jgi:hypothetical protein